MDSLRKLAASVNFVKESIVDAISYEDREDYSFVGLCQGGLTEEASGNLAAAEESYLAALAGAERNGIESLGVLLPTNLLADLYQRHARFSEAERLYLRAIGIFDKHEFSSREAKQAMSDEFGKANYAQFQAMFEQFKTVTKIFHPGQNNLQIRLLESYVALLRKTDRRADAEAFELRAEALRIEQERS